MQKCSHSLCCRENKPICVTPHDLPLNALKMTYLDPIGNFYCCAGLMDNFPFISALRDFNLSNNKFRELPKGESFFEHFACHQKQLEQSFFDSLLERSTRNKGQKHVKGLHFVSLY